MQTFTASMGQSRGQKTAGKLGGNGKPGRLGDGNGSASSNRSGTPGSPGPLGKLGGNGKPGRLGDGNGSASSPSGGNAHLLMATPRKEIRSDAAASPDHL
jgi:hypothetical protein